MVANANLIQKKLNSILGKGWRFPFRFDEEGRVHVQDSKTGHQATEMINQSLRVIIGTSIGQRVIRRSFGSILPLLVDEPMNSELKINIHRFVINAIRTHEKRIQLQETTIDFVPDKGLVNINLRYVILQTHVEGNLVYPFYLNS